MSTEEDSMKDVPLQESTVDKMELLNQLEGSTEQFVRLSSQLQTSVQDENIQPTTISNLTNLEGPSLVDIESLKQITGETDTPEDQTKENNEESNPEMNVEDIKSAQDEIKQLDVLVCGSCHSTFNFVDEFNIHKATECCNSSEFRRNIIETKPQVWAFLLWKNAEQKAAQSRGSGHEENSWQMYQKWVNLNEMVRKTWVAAGEAVMQYTTFGISKTLENVTEPEPVTKRADEPMDTTPLEDGRPVVMKKLVQRDSAGEIKEIRGFGVKKRKVAELKEDLESLRNQLEDEPTTQNIEENKENTVAGDTLQEEEFVVEKIVSRRFNPKRKQYEYLLKWEGYPSEQNTWEPAENLETCQHLLKAFEENLAKQAKQRGKKSAAAVAREKSLPTTPIISADGRPVRHSKQKALNQVRQWCGSIKPDETEIESTKKRGADSDEGMIVKKSKLDLDSDSEGSIGGGRVVVTKGAGGIIRRNQVGNKVKIVKDLNGDAIIDSNLAVALGLESSGDESDPSKSKLSPLSLLNQKTVSKTSLSPANQQVLVANAKGVVKVDPSQVPNLSSGVYIMSNKSGIIKLDSVSPSKALSLKQGAVKQQVITPTPGPKPASTSASGGVVVLKDQSGVVGTTKSGIVRRKDPPGILKSSANRTPVSRQVAATNKSPGTIRIEPTVAKTSPGVSRISSGILPRSAFTGQESPNKANKLPSRITQGTIQVKSTDADKKGIVLKNPNRSVARGAVLANRRPGGNHRGPVGTYIEDIHKFDDVFFDFPEESSNESDDGIDDPFPKDLPPVEPASPPRPLTLCPMTGKKLQKAEGEKTPEPTPPPSPTPPPPPPKEEPKPTPSGTTAKSAKSKQFQTLVPNETPKNEEEEEDEIVTITGEDGVIYKVSKSDLSNSLLVTGEDGAQCVYLTTGEGDDEGAVLTLDPSSYGDQLGQVRMITGDGDTQYYVKDGDELVGLEVEGGGELEEGTRIQVASGVEAGSEEEEPQVVAQLVEAGEPAPGGGPRRVVLLLPDGNFMMTEVDEEQYAALELDK